MLGPDLNEIRWLTVLNNHYYYVAWLGMLGMKEKAVCSMSSPVTCRELASRVGRQSQTGMNTTTSI